MLSRSQLPEVVCEIPGPGSREFAERLARHECPDTTYLAADFPVFWERAQACNVWDADGNRFVDLTAAFGVCTLGHAHPEVVAAVQRQSTELMHGMGDVHPSALKVRLAEQLARLAPGNLDVVQFGSSGSDAIEAAMKTSAVATGRPGFLAFEGAYHGLGFGALSLTWRDHFRAPFRAQLNPHVAHLGFPHDSESEASHALDRVDRLLASSAGDEIGAVVVEPILGRGGVVVPHASFLPGLREICTRRSRLLVLDEVFTGLGRTGRWFACQHVDVQPDLLCVGKSLAGGMPLSACIGHASVMHAWERSQGEARHTSTFLAHPVACAAALAQLEALQREDWPRRVAERGVEVGKALSLLAAAPGVAAVRGRGLMWGLVLHTAGDAPDTERCARVVTEALRRGWIFLPAGDAGNVIELTPPFTLEPELVAAAVETLRAVLEENPPRTTGAPTIDPASKVVPRTPDP